MYEKMSPFVFLVLLVITPILVGLILGQFVAHRARWRKVRTQIAFTILASLIEVALFYQLLGGMDGNA